MKEIILLKDGELALKGLNRRTFEDILMKNIRQRLRHAVGEFKFNRSQSTCVISPVDENIDLDKAVDIIGEDKLPYKIDISYISKDLNYQTSHTYAERPSARAAAASAG